MFRILVPKTVKQAQEIDRKMRTGIWTKEIAKNGKCTYRIQ